MIYRSKEHALRRRAAEYLEGIGFPLTREELESIAVADFGLSHPEREGAQILTLFATDRISAKLIVLLPGQVLPEHWHPPVGSDPGKEEIVRGFHGTVMYFGDGLADQAGGAIRDDHEVLKGKADQYVCRYRTDLDPGVQIIIPPGRKHWLKGGPAGGCIISFSTCVRDILDQFTDQAIVRTTRIVED